MQSISSTSSSSSKKRRGASKRAIAGRSLLGAALLASTALIALPAGPAFAEDLLVDNNDQQEITTPVDLDGGQVFVGRSPGSDATLTISDGGSVEALQGLIAVYGDTKGTVTVSGTGSLQTDLYLGVGLGGEGVLNVLDGGYVRTDVNSALGGAAGSNGIVTVSGGTSKFIVEKSLVVGRAGEGTLNVSNGGSVRAGYDVTVGRDAGNRASGTVTVSGKDSRLVAGNDIRVGYQGEAALTVSNGGAAEAGDTFVVADEAGSTGVINIGAASGEKALAAGSLKGADGAAATISFGAGDGTILFNHTEENYGFDAIVSGNGLLKQEAGDTRLTGDWSAFTGTGEVSGGVLSVDTDFGGSMTVLAGGTVAGSKTIDGDAEFQDGGFFQVDISSTDVLDVAGTVTIGSGADVVLVSNGALAFELGVTTTIMTAGEIDGEFGAVLSDDVFNGSLFLEGTLSYTETTIDLTLDRNDVAFSDFTRTPTQAAIADAVESLGQGNGVFDAFLVLTEKDDV
ncbi:hypothetical protein E2A64_17720, partial [Pseudohoeflea suaedae]